MGDGLGVRPAMTSAPSQQWHRPVMVEEVLHYLNPKPGAVIVDGTVGTGGHSMTIAPRLLPNGRLIIIDRDGSALLHAQERLVEFESLVTSMHDSYRNIPAILERVGISRIDGLLLDLGMSSVQVDHPSRGFSFAHEGPLDMRFDPEQARTAATLVNSLSIDELTALLEQYGEERFARRIARRMVEARRTQPLVSTTQLARLVVEALPPQARHGRLHAATRTFQALRIAVNDELDALDACLSWLPEVLAPGGRAVFLTFHSLEDRVVKRACLEGWRAGQWTLLTRKPLAPRIEEAARNPRARSVKLRAMERQ